MELPTRQVLATSKHGYTVTTASTLTFHPAELVQEQQQLALDARERQLHQTVGVYVDQMGARVGGRVVLFLLQQRVGRGAGRLVGTHREAQEPRVPGVVFATDTDGAVVNHYGRRIFGGTRRSGGPGLRGPVCGRRRTVRNHGHGRGFRDGKGAGGRTPSRRGQQH